MSTTAEISYAIHNDRPSFMIYVSAQKEGDSFPDLHGMLSQIQEAITEFQKKPPAKLLSNTEVSVQDVSHFTPATQAQQEKQFSSNKGKRGSENDSPGSVTKKQIGLIRVNLKFRDIPEKDFCASHDIAHIEDLSLNQARALIMNEDY